MKKKLEQAKAEYIDKLKRLKLAQAGVSYDDIDTYVKYLTADKEKEIEQQAKAIVADIKKEDSFGDVYVDDRVWKPFGN